MFEVGKTYWMNSACDHNCIWEFRVVKRTDKSVWLQQIRNGEDVEEVTRKKVVNHGDEESCFPLGKFSMCPVLMSDKVSADEEEQESLTVEEAARAVLEMRDEPRFLYGALNDLERALAAVADQDEDWSAGDPELYR